MDGINIAIHYNSLPGEGEIQSFCLNVDRITGCGVDVACPQLSDWTRLHSAVGIASPNNWRSAE